MCLSFLITYRYRYGTMARRRRRSWLAKRAEPGTHVPTQTAPKAPLLARKASRYFISYTVPVRYRYYTLLRLYTPVFGIPMTADSIFFIFWSNRPGRWRNSGFFYFYVLAPHNCGGGGEDLAGGRGLRGAVVPHQSPSIQIKYALQVCFSHRKLFKEVRSPPSIYIFLLTFLL